MSYVHPNAMTVAEREAVSSSTLDAASSSAVGSAASMRAAQREIARSTFPFGNASPQQAAQMEIRRSTFAFGDAGSYAAAQREIARSTFPFGGLGAVSAAKMNSLDSQARAKIPASLRNLFKVTPFIPKYFKDQFLAKPVSTMLSKFNVTGSARSQLVGMINKSAKKQGVYNKTMRVGSTNMKVYATSKQNAATLASLWIYLMKRNPIASIQAVLEVQWGAAGAIIAPVANAIGVLVGLGRPGLKGLGATPSGVASDVSSKPPATSNEPSTAASVASSIGGAAVIMTSVAAIAGIMSPILLPLIGQITGVKAPAPTQEQKVWPEGGDGGDSGAQSEEEGGMPAWLLPAGVGVLLGGWWLSRKK